MKKQLFILVQFLAVAYLSCTAQTFQKTYGGTAGDYAYCVQQTNDDGFIVAGQTVSLNPNFYYDVYLIKLNGIGDTSWTKLYSAGSFSIESRYVEQNSDSGYIVCGKAGNSSFLIRTNAAGNILWSKIIAGFTFITANEVHQTSDGGFIVIGTVSPLTGPENILLLKTDGSGNITWQKIFSSGANNYDDGYSVRQTNDGGYIITGATINPAVSSGMLLVKTDATGSVLWTKTFNAPGTFNIGWSIRQTADSGYVIAGQTYTTNYNAYMIKTNSTGDTLWTRAYGGANPDYARAVQQTSDGGYMLAGITQSFGSGGAEGYLVKTDSVGNFSWSKAYGGATVEITYFGMQTNDGGYITAGSTTSFGSGSVDVYLVKTDASGNSGCNEMNAGTVVNVPPCIVGTVTFTVSSGVAAPALSLTTGSGGTVTSLCFTSDIHEMENEELPITIYPNPFSSETTISFTDFIQSGEVEIFTMQGKKIYGSKIVNATEINVRVENMVPGMYFVKISYGKHLFVRKVIIQ